MGRELFREPFGELQHGPEGLLPQIGYYLPNRLLESTYDLAPVRQGLLARLPSPFLEVKKSLSILL